MPDSQLNEAERHLQHSFRKSLLFNSLVLSLVVFAAHLWIRGLPDLRALPPSTSELFFRAVALPPAQSPLRLVGAWEMQTRDRRFGGISGLANEGGNFLAVSDRGSVTRFPQPSAANPRIWIADLRNGPGSWGEKWARDAESLALDPRGRGWWVGYEQSHSLFLYDFAFDRVLDSVDLQRGDWHDNRGAEGLLTERDHLLVTAENGRQILRVTDDGIVELPLSAGTDVAEAARAPDGSVWLLLRAKGLGGIRQSIAPIFRSRWGYRAGPAWPVPKGVFDNYEGMAIETGSGGGLRFWLVTDDGHRFMARNLLVALDYDPSRYDKSPAQGTGLSIERKR